MGMFDWVRSSFDLGEQFTNVECQTKEIDDFIGGSMTHYWIDPSGLLWAPNYTGTNELEIIEPGDPDYDDKFKFSNWRWKKTGKHGIYSVQQITKYVSIYPSHWDGDWVDWPTVRVHFKDGKVIEHEETTLGKTRSY